jgi:hypothetical protein
MVSGEFVMKLEALKQEAKKHTKLYAFFWGMPLYRKVMSCIQNRLKNHIDRDGLSGFGIAVRATDIFLSLWMYGCNYAEYNWYGFKKLTHRERKEYIGDCCRRKYYAQLNDVAAAECFRNKYGASQVFQPFFGRQAVLYHTEHGYERFWEIIRAYGTAMVKPSSASG